MKTKRKILIPLIILIASLLLLIADFIFTSTEMNLGFWLRISVLILIIGSMYATIRERKKQHGNENRKVG